MRVNFPFFHTVKYLPIPSGRFTFYVVPLISGFEPDSRVAQMARGGVSEVSNATPLQWGNDRRRGPRNPPPLGGLGVPQNAAPNAETKTSCQKSEENLKLKQIFEI